jgi:hypothetical protein
MGAQGTMPSVVTQTDAIGLGDLLEMRRFVNLN